MILDSVVTLSDMDMGKYDGLDEAFNLENSKVEVVKDEVETPVDKVKKPELTKDDIEKDYEYARGNYYSIIEKGQEALNGILELAQETEQARAYEVAGQLIKSVSDAADKLLELQKTKKDIQKEDEKKGPTNVTNALFVGSTAELSKLLKKTKDEDS